MTAPQITKVLNPPLISDSVEDFNVKAFQTVGDLNPMMAEVNTVATYINTKSSEVAANVATAAGAATAASNAKTAAESARDTAITKASEASTSATAAGNAKTAAESARDTAITKAGEASTSATAASNAKTSAESARDTAITKAGEASTSATAAGNAKTSAESARDTATTKAGEASTSATAAGNAKTAAESARDTAVTKAGEASASATAAATSATNAANSAAAAAQSAADAEAIATGDLLANTAPEALGTSAVGTSSRAARSDHVHLMPTAAQVGATPAAHAGAGGAAHADATTLVSGFMSGADKTKLVGIAENATANATDAQLRDRSTHTGTQAISTVSGLQSALDGKEATIASGTTAQYRRGDKTWQDFAAAVRASVLTGLSLATNAAVTASDTVLSAIGKLQKQFSDHFANTSNPHSVTAAQVGATPAAHAGSGGAAHANATTSVAGFMSAVDKVKLDGVATGATANQTDAHLLNRANHTGTQAQSTVTDLTTDLSGKASAVVVDGSANTFNLASAGNAVPITANSTIPTNASVAYPVGTCIMLQCGSTSRTISGPGSNTLTLEGSATTVSSFTLKANKSVVIRKTATDAWRVYGDV